MAAADIVKTEWGYLVGGTGTDATSINSGVLVVKAMAFAGNADNATCSLTSDAKDANGDVSATSCYKWKTNANDLDCVPVYFGEAGVRLRNLTATLSHASDRLYVYVK